MAPQQRPAATIMDALTPLRPAHAAARDLSSADAQLESWDYAVAMLHEHDEDKVAHHRTLAMCLAPTLCCCLTP
jgi:hypothetical protein